MDLQNGYKVVYEKVDGDNRVFYASTTGNVADAKEIASIPVGNYKLIYEVNGQLYGSVSGIPADGDDCFDALDEIFVAKEGEEVPAAYAMRDEEPIAEVPAEEPVIEEPVNTTRRSSKAASAEQEEEAPVEELDEE